MRKHHLATTLAMFFAITSSIAAPVKPTVEFFPLSDLRLLDGPFHQAMELDQKYILFLDADRLLAGFRLNAGLPEKAKVYGGWEARGISGQTLGHYLSACAQMYASTGDGRFLDKLNYALDELTACQAASPNGFIGGMPRGVELFAELTRGDIRTKGGFDLNGGWVPWYNQHKLFAGLRDAYLLTHSEKAKTAYIRLGDWCHSVVANLTDAQMQTMLAVEQGGMMETLADLYAITHDEKYLTLAKRFWHKAVLDPLSTGQDKLTGLHANTNIPKVIGAARLYELTGDEKYKTTANTFWTIVTRDRSYVTGSNSDREHFFKLGVEAKKLGPQNGESCNVYNMLKLTSHLNAWGERDGKYDFYEKALFNHILGSIDPESGMFTYFQSLEAGRFKVYSTPENSFWCCVGTGLENHAKYTEHVYTHTADSLQVNLFLASQLTWKDKGLTLRQETTFPQSDATTLTLKLDKPTKLKLQIRVPGWAESGISVSGAATATAAPGSDYLTIDREWKNGDTLAVKMPMKLHLHRASDEPNTVAFLYGPVVLAGELGRWNFPDTDIVHSQTLFDFRPLPDVPTLVTTDFSLAFLKPLPGKPLTFTTDIARTGSASSPLTLSPIAHIHHQRYAVYFKMLSEPQYSDLQAQFERDRQAARELAARTVDAVAFAEQQSEKDHNLKSENSFSAPSGGKGWRDARNGGYFTITLKAKPNEKQSLACTYWGSDGGNRSFDILANGTKLATQKLTAAHPDQFFDIEYPLPADLLAGKDSIDITFKAHPNATAGGVFGARILLSH